MTTFLNKHKMITAQAVASATLVGLVSVSVAKPLRYEKAIKTYSGNKNKLNYVQGQAP